MKTFNQYISEGRSRGEAMEDVIVSAVNGNPSDDPNFGIPAEAGVYVAKFLKQNKITGKAEVLGASQMEVTDQWQKFWPEGKVPPTTKTPKTDFVVGKAKISLKSGDGAQLMSGGRNESLATFYTALDKTKGNMQEEMVDKLTRMFEGLAPSSVASGKLAKVIKDKSDEVVNKANEAHKQLQTELKKIFESNSKFRDAFAYEAMSGEVKFGGGLGTCSHFLVTDFDGKSNKLHSVKDSNYVSYIAKQMNIAVRFKTSSVKKVVGSKKVKTGEYRYWSVIGLIVNKMLEDVDDMLNGKTVLTEANVKDFFRRVWQRIRAVFVKAKDYIMQNVKNLFEFLEVEPQVSFKNNVKF